MDEAREMGRALAYELARETYKFDVATAPAGAGTRSSALAGATA
jgi:hypothetical protein